MTGSDSGTGVAGSSFTHYNYPGIYQNQDFHHCGLEPGDDIVNYDNRVEVQTCELVNLAECVSAAHARCGDTWADGRCVQSCDGDGVRAEPPRAVRERLAVVGRRRSASGRCKT